MLHIKNLTVIAQKYKHKSNDFKISIKDTMFCNRYSKTDSLKTPTLVEGQMQSYIWAWF